MDLSNSYKYNRYFEEGSNPGDGHNVGVLNGSNNTVAGTSTLDFDRNNTLGVGVGGGGGGGGRESVGGGASQGSSLPTINSLGNPSRAMSRPRSQSLAAYGSSVNMSNMGLSNEIMVDSLSQKDISNRNSLHQDYLPSLPSFRSFEEAARHDAGTELSGTNGNTTLVNSTNGDGMLLPDNFSNSDYHDSDHQIISHSTKQNSGSVGSHTSYDDLDIRRMSQTNNGSSTNLLQQKPQSRSRYRSKTNPNSGDKDPITNDIMGNMNHNSFGSLHHQVSSSNATMVASEYNKPMQQQSQIMTQQQQVQMQLQLQQLQLQQLRQGTSPSLGEKDSLAVDSLLQPLRATTVDNGLISNSGVVAAVGSIVAKSNPTAPSGLSNTKVTPIDVNLTTSDGEITSFRDLISRIPDQRY